MGKTYAPTGIVIGFFIGVLAALKINIVVGIIVGLVACIILWVLIRAFDNVIYKAGDTAEDAIKRKYKEMKDKK